VSGAGDEAGESEEKSRKAEMTAPARISIGLPVFNGERYLSRAIESVLAQSFGDFELLIADNASTDATWDICRSFAEKDKRIRLVRHDENCGAFANFKFVLDQASLPYFMWMAHDDVLHPDYVARCYGFLESNPDYVLCFAKNGTIDETGDEIDFYDYDDMTYFDVDADDPVQRYGACLNNLPPPFEVYGMFRTDVIKKAKRFRLRDGVDQILVLELSLLGKFHRIPEVLRHYRIKTTKTGVDKRLTAQLKILRPPGAPLPLIPYTKIYVGLISVGFDGHLPLRDSLKLLWGSVWHRRLLLSLWWDVSMLIQLLTYRYPPLYNWLRSVALAAAGRRHR
jgi:glycosyltransferase involved in cell wall biosynthesis